MRNDYAAELLGIIAQVRRRWRQKLALRGALLVIALGFVVFLASASGLEAAKFSATAIIWARVTLALTVAGLAAWFFVRPLMQRVTDERVALYLEEHEPSLQESLISAVEATQTAGEHSAASDALVQRLVQTAIARAQQIENGRHVERAPVRR